MTAMLKKGLRVAAVIAAAVPAALMISVACVVWWKVILFVWSA